MSPVDLPVRRGLVIPAGEIREAASRSSGPGGQHVNKTATRVSLRWSVAQSAVLSEAQRARLRSALASRLTGAGELVVHAGRCRSRARNRERARDRLAELVREALRVRPARVATRVSKGARERTLAAKKRRAVLKRRRAPVRSGDD